MAGEKRGAASMSWTSAGRSLRCSSMQSATIHSKNGAPKAGGRCGVKRGKGALDLVALADAPCKLRISFGSVFYGSGKEEAISLDGDNAAHGSSKKRIYSYRHFCSNIFDLKYIYMMPTLCMHAQYLVNENAEYKISQSNLQGRVFSHYRILTTLIPRDQCDHPQIVKGLESVEVKDAAGSGVVSMAIEASFPGRVQALSGHQIVQESLLKEIEHALGSPFGTGTQAPAPKPLVLVISGPSGVGKDAVINRLKKVRDEIHFVVTATTRPRRPGEIDGKDYFFVTREEFEVMIQSNELLEHAVVYGDFKGIPKRQVRDCLSKGFDVVLRVDVQGAATIRSILGSGAVFIFLVAESEAALVKRLVERKTETKDKLLLRIATAREELKRMSEFDYVVVNADGQLEKTVSLISHIIDAEKALVHQREASL
ncbi:hypothetical protein L7F22_066727 [Adiantum nelumboides]|nr:hypothetical protein [Adiantum nelumboides]